MNRLRLFRSTVTAAIAIGALAAASSATDLVAAAPPPSQDDNVIATFEGRTIRLADGWGSAGACAASTPTSARCYRTQAEMDAAEGWTKVGRSVSPQVACGSSLLLYRSAGYAGGILALSTRQTVLNLSAYGFDNDTSSYQIGGCSARFYDGSSGGAPQYPGATSAGSSSASMTSGWDNRVSSVYIT